MIWLSFCLFIQLDPETQRAFKSFFEKNHAFQVTFHQVTESAFLDSTEASGTLSISQPGKLRMDYHSGEEKTIICDGVTYFEEDRLAEIKTQTPLEELKEDPLVRMLLFGDDLEQFFLIDRYKGKTGVDIFRLRPRNDTSGYIEMTFDVNWLPTTLAFISEEGERTHFKFTNFEANPTFKKNWFEIPE